MLCFDFLTRLLCYFHYTLTYITQLVFDFKISQELLYAYMSLSVIAVLFFIQVFWVKKTQNGLKYVDNFNMTDYY